MSNIVLFELEGCPFCRKVRAALKHKKLSFVRRVVKTSADYVELGRYNPARQAPVLLYDSEVIPDSTDILHFLEKKHPHPRLFPASSAEAALCHFLEDWSDEALSWYGSTFRWIDPRNARVASQQLRISGALGPFAKLFPNLGRLVGRARTLAQGIGRRPISKLEADLGAHLEKLAGFLENKPFLCGEEISAADLALWAQLWAMRFCVQEDIARRHKVIGPYLARIDALLALED